jgi:hypothetical protein
VIKLRTRVRHEAVGACGVKTCFFFFFEMSGQILLSSLSLQQFFLYEIHFDQLTPKIATVHDNNMIIIIIIIKLKIFMGRI